MPGLIAMDATVEMSDQAIEQHAQLELRVVPAIGEAPEILQAIGD
jgi:hypothetical protein